MKLWLVRGYYFIGWCHGFYAAIVWRNGQIVSLSLWFMRKTAKKGNGFCCVSILFLPQVILNTGLFDCLGFIAHHYIGHVRQTYSGFRFTVVGIRLSYFTALLCVISSLPPSPYLNVIPCG